MGRRVWRQKISQPTVNQKKKKRPLRRKYPDNLASLILIILFSETLKVSKYVSSNSQNVVKEVGVSSAMLFDAHHGVLFLVVNL